MDQIEGRVLYPIGYGADPTGEDDSSSAIMEALDDALKSQKNGAELLPGVKDLGGLILDFQGGDFRISHPIIFPPGVGNIVVSTSFNAITNLHTKAIIIIIYSTFCY